MSARAMMRAAALTGLLALAAGGARAQEPRKQPPAPLPAHPVAVPAFRELTLANGLKLIVVPRHDLPVASIDLFVRSGTGSDPAGKEGLAALTADLLTKGTTARSAKQIADEVETAGGSLDAFAERDYLGIYSTVLAEKLPLGMELVSDVVLHATFPEDELATARKRALSSLQMELSDPSTVATRVLGQRHWGATSPYGTFSTAASLNALTGDDVKAWYARSFKAGNALLVVAGDVDPVKVQALAQKWLGGWQGGTVASVVLPPPPKYPGMQIFLVHRPGSVQSNIKIEAGTMLPASPDYRPLEVATHILGGGTDARLFMILREQHGWTYGSYASLWRPRLTGAFVATAEVRTAVTDSALSEMLKQIQRLGTEPVGPADLNAAKGFMAGSFPLRLQSARSVARQIANARLLGLPLTDFTRYPEEVRAVTPVQLQRAAARYLAQPRLLVAVVGDAPKIKESLEKIGPVTVLDVEGKALDLMALKAAPPALYGSLLKASKLEYAMTMDASPSGTIKASLERDGDAWVVSQNIDSNMFTMQWDGRMRVADLSPLSLKQTMAGGPMSMTIDLKQENGRITGTAKQPVQMGGDRTFDLAAPAGTLLPGFDGYALAVLPLESGKTLTLPMLSARSGSIENVTYKVVGEEQVKVPAGTFDTFKVEAGGEMPTTLWLLKSLPHTMVRMEFQGMPVVMELTTAP